MKSGNATPGINDAAAVAAFAINEFEAAKKYLETANENKEPLRLANRYRISLGGVVLATYRFGKGEPAD